MRRLRTPRARITERTLGIGLEIKRTFDGAD